MFRVVEGDGEWDLIGVTSASVVSVRVELDSRICMPSNVLGRTPSLPLFQALIRDAILCRFNFNPHQTATPIQSKSSDSGQIATLVSSLFREIYRRPSDSLSREVRAHRNDKQPHQGLHIIRRERIPSIVIDHRHRTPGKIRQPQQGNHVLLSVRQVRDALQWW